MKFTESKKVLFYALMGVVMFLPICCLIYVAHKLVLIVQFGICFKDTIISWRDPEQATDLALSFQETTGCAFIW